MTELDSLVRAIELEVVRPRRSCTETAASVARALEPRLTVPGLLTPEQMQSAEDGYRTNVLHVAPDGAFSVVALVWRPGQRTPIHSHRCWCVVGVVQGREEETTYEVAGDDAERALRAVGSQVHGPGATTWLVPPGDLHRVANGCDELTVSIHVYGMDYAALGSSIFAIYPDAPVDATS